LRHEGKAEAGRDHGKNPVVAVAAIHPFDLRAVLGKNIARNVGLLAIDPIEVTLAVEVTDADFGSVGQPVLAQERASWIPRAENHTVVRGFTTFSNTPGLSTSSTNGISVLVSSEALVSVTRPNPKGEANALECNNRRVVPPPQPEHRPSHESRDRGYRLRRTHLGHCLAGDAYGAADHRITPPMPPRVGLWAGELVGLLRKLA